jgi:hypothetical protein
VNHLLKEPKWTELKTIGISPEALDRFAQNVQGLFLFGITSGFLRATALAAAAVSTIVLARRLGIRAGVAIVSLMLIMALGLFAYSYGTSAGEAGGLLTGFIRPVIKVVLDAAREAGVTVDVSNRDLDLAILLDVLALNFGFNSLLACYGAIAIRATAADLTPTLLTQRGRALEWVAIMTAALLVFVTAVNKTLIVWPQGFLTPDGQKTYGYVAGAIADYWGAFGSGVLIFALLPTYVSLMADVASAARIAVGDSEKAQDEWRKENGLEFDFKSGAIAAITAAAPILTGPSMDLFGKLFR